ncbi:MAG: hypothetical protein CME19_22965 [Gemmatimonadetes bacterium]|nr:hypothetical protein [Gemmatimonadota bacterium]
MGFNLLSLANNHAGEGGRDGFTYTRELATRMGFAATGTGATLIDAAYLEVGHTTIGLVALDTANAQTREWIAGEECSPEPASWRGGWRRLHLARERCRSSDSRRRDRGGKRRPGVCFCPRTSMGGGLGHDA